MAGSRIKTIPAYKNPMTRNVGTYLYPEVEVLDFAGPFEVFTTASRVSKKLTPGDNEPFKVFSIAQATDPVQARAGLSIVPEYTFKTQPDIDVLIIPGGVVDKEHRELPSA